MPTPFRMTSERRRTIFADTPKGPRPSLRVHGGEGADPADVAADLTDWWRERLATLPDGDFPAPKWLGSTKRDSTIRRGWIARTGRIAQGQWLYRLTDLGLGMRNAIIDKNNLEKK